MRGEHEFRIGQRVRVRHLARKGTVAVANRHVIAVRLDAGYTRSGLVSFKPPAANRDLEVLR